MKNLFFKLFCFLSQKELRDLKKELKKEVQGEPCYCCHAKLDPEKLRLEKDKKWYVKCDTCKMDIWIK